MSIGHVSYLMKKKIKQFPLNYKLKYTLTF